jgi:hypothetical protein
MLRFARHSQFDSLVLRKLLEPFPQPPAAKSGCTLKAPTPTKPTLSETPSARPASEPPSQIKYSSHGIVFGGWNGMQPVPKSPGGKSKRSDANIPDEKCLYAKICAAGDRCKQNTGHSVDSN